jgi:hypothetical protein
MVKDDEVYKVRMMADFDPYRRKVDFRSGSDVSIRPLIESVSFIKDKKRWDPIPVRTVRDPSDQLLCDRFGDALDA